MDEGLNNPVYCNFTELTGMEMDGKNFDQIVSLVEPAKKNGQWLVLADHRMGDSRDRDNTARNIETTCRICSKSCQWDLVSLYAHRPKIRSETKVIAQ